MDFDFTSFDKDIERYDLIHAQNDKLNDNKGTTMGAQELSRKIAQKIAGLLPDLDENTPKEDIEKISYLCSKMVEFSPYLSIRRILQGQFYLQIKDFKNAAVSFMSAYNIEKDEVGYRWPYLQPTETNAGLLVWMGYALFHSGETHMGKTFFELGKEWTAQKPSAPEPGE